MPFYAKRREFTALNDTARVLRVIPVIELRVLQTIYSPNSCTTFRKSCTTVTPLLKKNLGFSQIEILRVSFPDFSRRFSVSLAKSIDTFFEVLLKDFTLSRWTSRSPTFVWQEWMPSMEHSFLHSCSVLMA